MRHISNLRKVQEVGFTSFLAFVRAIRSSLPGNHSLSEFSTRCQQSHNTITHAPGAALWSESMSMALWLKNTYSESGTSKHDQENLKPGNCS